MTRSMVISEIIRTEQDYVKSLLILQNEFYLPLSKLADDAGLDDLVDGLKTVFGQAPALIALNKKIRDDLIKARKSAPNEADALVGKVFKNFAPFLKIYTPYLNSFKKSVACLQKLTEDDVFFRDFCAETTRECGGRTLHSLLIKPVQRIPQYTLQLGELLKYTPEGHPDREATKCALDAISAVGKHCNDNVSQVNDFEESLAVGDRFRGEKLLPPPVHGKPRIVIKEGYLKKVNRRGVAEDRVFILFNDVLAYGTGVAGVNVRLHRVIDLSTIQIHSLADAEPSSPCQAVIAAAASLGASGDAKSYVVQAETELAMRAWITKIQNQQEKLHQHLPRSSMAFANPVLMPVWTADTAACQICELRFTLIRRRHHCRLCGLCICATCSPDMWHLPYINQSKASRVCTICYEKLSNHPETENECVEEERELLSNKDVCSSSNTRRPRPFTMSFSVSPDGNLPYAVGPGPARGRGGVGEGKSNKENSCKRNRKLPPAVPLTRGKEKESQYSEGAWAMSNLKFKKPERTGGRGRRRMIQSVAIAGNRTKEAAGRSARRNSKENNQSEGRKRSPSKQMAFEQASAAVSAATRNKTHCTNTRRGSRIKNRKSMAPGYLHNRNKESEVELRKWLRTVLPKSASSLGDNAPLTAELKTGVLLCELLNALKPGAIDKSRINRPKTVFCQMSNISAFVTGCRESGLLKSNQVFKARDLYEQKNTSAVLHTLEALRKVYNAHMCNGIK